MNTADELRKYAHECLVWAEQANTPAERKSLLDISKALIQSAIHDGIAVPNGQPHPVEDSESPFVPDDKAVRRGGSHVA
jgi:hypothetical protein